MKPKSYLTHDSEIIYTRTKDNTNSQSVKINIQLTETGKMALNKIIKPELNSHQSTQKICGRCDKYFTPVAQSFCQLRDLCQECIDNVEKLKEKLKSKEVKI